MREGKQRKQIHLGARFPDSDSRLEFESFQQLAQTAERGLFDFIFLPEGYPDTLSMLSALAAVTDRLGLVGTVDTTSGEPFEVARQFATLDHLSDGRAAWNIATLDGDGYERAAEFLAVAREFWDSWEADAIRPDESTGVYVDPDRVHDVSHRGAHFDVRGLATLPAGPQGHPILLHAGESADGRDFGARHADALFTPHLDLASGQKYYTDVTARVVANGRDPARVKVFAVIPGGLGGTPERVADELDLHVQSDACDGFILTPDGLDDFVANVVPLLQERSAFRSEYNGTTLRDHLGVTAGLR